MSNDRRDRIEIPHAGSVAGKNAADPIDYAQRVLKAQDLAEVMRLHREYMQVQLRALTEPANELRQLVRAARGALIWLKT